MADVVNLDALIPREDFLAPQGSETGGESGKASASVTDLTKGESFFSTLRKPDFQRETAAWSPVMIRDFVQAFIENDLIPSVICWQSPARLSFVIDGAHRLSAIVAWILDDYGYGDISKAFYNFKIPDEQIRIDKKTRELIDKEIGSYKKFRAETQIPGSAPELAANARALAHSNIPLLWVKGSDSAKAERAFFTINQSAVEINPTELKILNARTQANAISARAIVRNAAGHKYWQDFSQAGREEIEDAAKKIYAALYSPPLNPPIRTEDLPIAGHGYGSQTLPLIFDLVNIASKLPVVDASKLKKRFALNENREQPSEAGTIQVIRNAEKLVRRITGTHSSSLGLHPAVYFYAANGRHQPTSVLAMVKLIVDLEASDRFNEFSKHRAAFEAFLINHKMFVNQLTVKHGSMVKGFLPLKEYYEFVLARLGEGMDELSIEESLGRAEAYRTLVKEKPILTQRAKAFSTDAKQFKMLSDVLANAFICNVCGARLDKKSMHLDHATAKRDGGLGTLDNGQWLHPYCDSTYKDLIASERKDESGN